MNVLNEVAQHCFGDFKVRDDAILERPDSDDTARRAAEHSLRFSADREHLFAATLVSLLHGNHGRFVANDSLVLDIDQGVGGPEINRKIFQKDAEKGTENMKTPLTSRPNRKSRAGTL